MVRGAVFHEVGQEKAEIRDDIEVSDPGPGQVKVAIRAAGVCRSDLSAMDGTLPQPPPCVLGHEGSGEVVAVGDGVARLSVGDRVIVAWMPPCGACPVCLRGQPYLCLTLTSGSIANPRFRVGDTPYHGLSGIGMYVEEVTLPEQAAIAIPDDVPFDIAALIGCGVMTGVGSATNVAAVEPGSSVLVVGCGGVGIAAIQGARLAGAAEIVAVDPVVRKLAWAEQFGATHAVSPEGVDAVKEELTGGDGFDYALDVVGSSTTIRSSYDHTRRGGTLVVVGVGRADDTVEFSAFELFFMDRTIRSSIYGGADVRVDFARLIRLWRAGRLDLESMITQRLSLDELNDGFEAMRRGEVIRQVVVFD